MKRPVVIFFFATVFALSAAASHITGGEMFYTFRGVTNGIYQYDVTLRLLQRCASGRQFPNPAIISIFDKTNSSRVIDMSVPITNISNISISNPDPCITNPPAVCYDVAFYKFSVLISSHIPI